MTGMTTYPASAAGEMVQRFGNTPPTYWIKSYLEKLEYGRATTGFLTIEDTKITSKAPILLPLVDPVLDEEAVNKKYVDAKFAGGGYTLPPAGATTLGGVFAKTAPTGSYVTGIDATGTPTFGVPIIPPAYTLPIASDTVLGGIKIGSGLDIAADGTVSAQSGGASADLPLAGGTMTGTIAAPIAIPMSFMNTYSLFSQNGGVSFRFGATDLISFSSSGIYNYKPIYTPATGIGISFGTGGGYISKTGLGFSCYIGGAQRFSFDSTAHTSSVPIILPADPTADLQAATKKYVDDKPTIVSIPAGSTPPDSANYPNNTLLVEYTA
jgi:hypothetical protein